MLSVLYPGSGQMCNQMLMQMNILASAYEHGYKVNYRGFKMYDGPVYYDDRLNDIITPKGEPGFIIKAFTTFLQRAKIRPPRFIDASDEDAVGKIIRSGKLSDEKYYVYGWPFYDLDSLRKNAQLVRNYFSPDDGIKGYLTEKAEKYNHDESAILIGVHIRRKDYISWQNGAYYFDDTVYKRFMDMMCHQLESTGRRIVFLLFSDENIDLSNYHSDGYEIHLERGSAMQDFYMLSYCDYLISPPSTFSGLASFLGNVPRFIISDKNDTLTLEKCHVWLMETDGWINPL